MRLLLTLVLLALCQATAKSEDGNQQIEMRQIKYGSRNGINIPEAEYSNANSSVNVKFLSSYAYFFSIENELGETECQYPLCTDGEKTFYPLPSLTDGTYTIIIENNDTSFEGEFYVE